MPISRIESNSIAPSQTLTTPIIATTMGVGGATPAGSGSGITFPAAQSASSDANTLDDYEEGSWTPIGNVLSNNRCRYTKVGRLVTVTGDINFITSSSTSSVSISGLPFSADSTCEYVGSVMMNVVTIPTGRSYVVPYFYGGTGAIMLYAIGTGNTWEALNWTHVSGKEIILTLTYHASA